MKNVNQKDDSSSSPAYGDNMVCRRKGNDRRSSSERRTDRRAGSTQKRSLKAWVRSITNPRLGVDRRKGGDQRIIDTSSSQLKSLLSSEEIEDLLK